ncbi:MtrAB system histidine kinase MtrB [Corynebacterium bovis]|uniref:Sensor histidine kinase MtrB n=1 Tax=Corynebacterium bovis DSM 20582 = CIP 54.80 TaxID=927655 RepID=A0A8H9Y773_9CORY|nr:two-component system sensor histidine kinase MtrB [Corynebacterium bovis DSM 20582 = CIP 54.80]
MTVPDAPRDGAGDAGLRFETVGEGVRAFMRRPQAVIRDAWRHLAHSWRTSIQLRVIGSVFMSSLVVIVILGFVLISFVGQQLLTSKHSSATEEMDRARAAVEEQIRASDTSNSLQVRLNAARSVLSDRTSTGSEPGAGAVYDPVLVAPDVNGGDVSSPAQNPVPESLREFVRQGQVSVQYATIPTGGQTASKTLIIGSPVAADIPGLELYLIMPLDNEESTLTLMRGLLSAGAIVLLVLLVVIAWVFSQQLTVPIRTASRIAERFATGHLRERMVVDGQDEVARLATSFNEMAEKLSRQIRQLKEFGDLQRQFTSDVSHELRTPLTTVRMAADLIHDNAEDLDPMTRRASELMNTELDRFESLLGDLLEISRHDAGVANLSAERVDIRGAVKSALGQVRAIAEDVGCEFVVDLPEDPVMVRIDSRRVERVLRNLLANAVDHSEGNPVNVTLRVGTESLAVTVVDHGMGLKPGEADLVFNRFWRSDPSRERRTGGTGLGLAIAKEDAQLHGGRLEATGEPGLGACFRLTLPLDLGTRVTASPLPLEIDRPTDADPDTGAGADAGAGAGGDGGAATGGDGEAAAGESGDADVDAGVGAAADPAAAGAGAGAAAAAGDADTAAIADTTGPGQGPADAPGEDPGAGTGDDAAPRDSTGDAGVPIVGDDGDPLPEPTVHVVDDPAGTPLRRLPLPEAELEGLTEAELLTAQQEAEAMDNMDTSDGDGHGAGSPDPGDAGHTDGRSDTE